VHSLSSVLFGSALRRWSTCVVANLIFYVGGSALQHHVLEVSASPGLALGLVFFWVLLGVLNGLITTLALGNLIVYDGFLDDFLRDEMAELDAKIMGEVADTEDEDIDALVRTGSGMRFVIVCLVLILVHLGVANEIPGGFMGRYTHPGVALTNLRNDDPMLRRQGIDLIANRLDFTITPAVDSAVLKALADDDDGVVARATFVAGILDLDAAVEPIGRLAVERPSLTFTSLISLGQLDTPASRVVAKRLVKETVVQEEPQALALMLGLLKVPLVDQLVAIYKAHPDNEDIRVAAIWSLGEMRDSRMLKVMTGALKDESLAVRCAASHGLEKMVVLDSSGALRAAFEAGDPYDVCPEKNLPVQEGGPIVHLVKKRSYMFGLIRALATTDDPRLLRWLVEHQEDTPDYRTKMFMKKVWERLEEKDARGELNKLKLRLRQKRMLEEAAVKPAPKTTPDAGPNAADAASGGAADGAR